MAISRILGASLVSNLDRQGVDLQFTTSGNALVYMDFAEFRLGINTNTPNQALEVNGNILVANGHIISWANLSSNIGSISNWFNTVHANTILSTNLYGTIQTADQPNITNVGALTSLTVVGDVNAGNLITSGTINTSGNLTVDNITANTITGVIETSEQPLITTLANIKVDSLATTGNISADYLVGNTVVSSNIYGVVLTETQPYISNLGNITVDSITIGGNVLITGNTSGGIINADEIYENGERVLTTNTSFTVTGDVVGSGDYSNINLTLTNTGVTAGTYGDTTVVPSISVDSQGRLTLASNLTLTKVGNITVNDTTITSTGNLTLIPSTGIVDVGNSRLSNIAAPITNSDAVTVDYLNSVLSTTANNLVAGDSILGLADTGTANLFLILDGNLVSSTTAESTTFLHPVNIGVLSFAGNTISSTTGNIQLDAQGTGIVQIVGADALGIPAGGISDRPGDPLIGYTRFNTDTNLIETWDGNSWSSPTTQTVTSEVITPDGVSNVFTLTSNASSAYGVLVSINGTLQQPVSAYDVNGNQITFTEIPQDTDIIEVRSIATGIVVTGLQRGTTEVQLTAGNVNISGNLLPQANVTYSLGSEDAQWKDLWVSSNTIYIGGTAVTVTDGALTVGGAGVGSTYGNSNVAGYLTTYTGNISANVIFANTVNYSNGVSILEGITNELTGNAAYQAGLIDALISNAAVQAGLIEAAVVQSSSNIANANLAMKGYVDSIDLTKANISNPIFTGTVAIPTLTLTNALAVAQGGTGATNSADALNNLLPSGEQGGYVLKTSGAGSYYWASESGSSGGTVGQQLTTLRQSNTATSGQTVFELVDNIEYTPGTGQLRVYVNGVRQFPDAYSETSSTSYTLSTGVTSGTVVFAEIDQFSTFNNYANLTYASNVGNISAVGLTVQSAIENLENNKAPLDHPVFPNDITVTGNIYLNGTSTYVSSNNLTLSDSLIYLAETNPSDSVDIGVVGSFTNGTYQHTGLARDASDGIWKLFANVVAEPTTTVDFTNAIYSDLRIGNLTAISSAFSSSVTIATTLAVTGNITAGNISATNLAGAITSAQVTDALGYTPYNSTNPNSYISGITSGMVTTALGYTPYNSTNPNGYISSVPNSSTQVSSLGVGTAASGTTGEIRATNNITAYFSSDARFKENVRDIPNALDKVSAIGGKLFDWTDEYIETHGGLDGYFLTKESFGVVAQDVKQVFPEAVRTREDGYLAVDYERMCALAFQAIKELQQQVQELQAQLKDK